MVFTTEGFLEVAIESWPEWDLNQQPLNSVQTPQPTELSRNEFNSLSEPTLHSHSNFISSLCSVFTFHFGLCFRQSPHLSQYIYIRNTEEKVGHLQQNISMIVSMFLCLLRCALDIFANVKRVSHRGEYGLEIPANISLCQPENVIKLAKK